MYTCKMIYSSEEMTEPTELIFDILHYNIHKDGENILPEFHVNYNKNMNIAEYNTLEAIALNAEKYFVHSIQVTDIIGNIVHSSNSWKKVIFYSCSGDTNSLLPYCQVRFQG